MYKVHVIVKFFSVYTFIMENYYLFITYINFVMKVELYVYSGR